MCARAWLVDEHLGAALSPCNASEFMEPSLLLVCAVAVDWSPPSSGPWNPHCSSVKATKVSYLLLLCSAILVGV